MKLHLRLSDEQKQHESKLPDGRTCNDCAHIEHCKMLFGINGNETSCDFIPSKFFDDVMTIFHRDGTKTEVRHPFRALQALDEEAEITTNLFDTLRRKRTKESEK